MPGEMPALTPSVSISAAVNSRTAPFVLASIQALHPQHRSMSSSSRTKGSDPGKLGASRRSRASCHAQPKTFPLPQTLPAAATIESPRFDAI